MASIERLAPQLSRWRVRAGYPVALAFLWLAHPSLRSIFVGASVSLLGLLLRAAAAGHLRKQEALATSGPYRFTRNPLYLGSTLVAAGLALAGNSWSAGAPVLLYLLLFYPPVMRREEQELRARFGGAFDDYAAEVPLFFPHFPLRRSRGPSPAPLPPGEFSWAQYRRNREFQAALGYLAGIGLLILKMIYGR